MDTIKTTSVWNKEDAKTVRDMIVHESNLMNQRLTWMMQMNGFLFAALAFAWRDSTQLVPVLAALGITTSLSIMRSLYIAHSVCNALADQWEKNKHSEYQGPGVIGHQTKKMLWSWTLPWFSLPFLLALSWVVVLGVLWLWPKASALAR
jgi:hypothetical protein